MFFLDFKPLVASSLQRQRYLMTGCVTKWSVDIIGYGGTRIFGKNCAGGNGTEIDNAPITQPGFSRGFYANGSFTVPQNFVVVVGRDSDIHVDANE
jgi:hypothetical protein